MTTKCTFLVLALALSSAAGLLAEPETSKKANAPEMIGVYDSRALSFAHFWSAPRSTERDALIKQARAAQKLGDEATHKKLKEAIEKQSKEGHLQVFSTAPATEALEALKDRLPALQKELGVDRLVSRWDERALRKVPEQSRIDVTDRLVKEFNPDSKRLKTIESMKTKPPIPMWKARLIMTFGGM